MKNSKKEERLLLKENRLLLKEKIKFVSWLFRTQNSGYSDNTQVDKALLIIEEKFKNK